MCNVNNLLKPKTEILMRTYNGNQASILAGKHTDLSKRTRTHVCVLSATGRRISGK